MYELEFTPNQAKSYQVGFDLTTEPVGDYVANTDYLSIDTWDNNSYVSNVVLDDGLQLSGDVISGTVTITTTNSISSDFVLNITMRYNDVDNSINKTISQTIQMTNNLGGLDQVAWKFDVSGDIVATRDYGTGTETLNNVTITLFPKNQNGELPGIAVGKLDEIFDLAATTVYLDSKDQQTFQSVDIVSYNYKDSNDSFVFVLSPTIKLSNEGRNADHIELVFHTTYGSTTYNAEIPWSITIEEMESSGGGVIDITDFFWTDLGSGKTYEIYQETGTEGYSVEKQFTMYVTSTTDIRWLQGDVTDYLSLQVGVNTFEILSAKLVGTTITGTMRINILPLDDTADKEYNIWIEFAPPNMTQDTFIFNKAMIIKATQLDWQLNVTGGFELELEQNSSNTETANTYKVSNIVFTSLPRSNGNVPVNLVGKLDKYFDLDSICFDASDSTAALLGTIITVDDVSYDNTKEQITITTSITVLTASKGTYESNYVKLIIPNIYNNRFYAIVPYKITITEPNGEGELELTDIGYDIHDGQIISKQYTVEYDSATNTVVQVAIPNIYVLFTAFNYTITQENLIKYSSVTIDSTHDEISISVGNNYAVTSEMDQNYITFTPTLSFNNISGVQETFNITYTYNDIENELTDSISIPVTVSPKNMYIILPSEKEISQYKMDNIQNLDTSEYIDTAYSGSFTNTYVTGEEPFIDTPDKIRIKIPDIVEMYFYQTLVKTGYLGKHIIEIIDCSPSSGLSGLSDGEHNEIITKTNFIDCCIKRENSDSGQSISYYVYSVNPSTTDTPHEISCVKTGNKIVITQKVWATGLVEVLEPEYSSDYWVEFSDNQVYLDPNIVTTDELSQMNFYITYQWLFAVQNTN